MQNSQTSDVLNDDDHFRNSVYQRVKEYRNVYGMMTAWYSRIRYLLLVPSTLITALTSCVAFVSSSDTFFDDTTKNHLNYAIGVVTIISTALQSYQAACNIDQKIKSFHVSTTAFRDLAVQIKFDTDMDRWDVGLIVDYWYIFIISSISSGALDASPATAG